MWPMVGSWSVPVDAAGRATEGSACSGASSVSIHGAESGVGSLSSAEGSEVRPDIERDCIRGVAWHKTSTRDAA